MKRVLSAILSLALLACLLPAASAERAVEEYHEGLAAFWEDGKWGYLDEAGAVAIPAQFEYAYDFQGGLARVRLDGREGMIDSAGTVVVPAEYDEVYYPVEGRIRVWRDGKCGYLDENGGVVTELIYTYGDSFSHGYAVVSQGNGVGMIDLSGKLVVSCRYQHIGAFTDDGVAQIMQDDKRGLLNTALEEIVPPVYLNDIYFENGLARVALDWGEDRTFKNWGVIDLAGNVIVSPVYDEIRIGDLPDGWFIVEQDGLYGALDAEGRVQYPCVFRTVESLTAGVERGNTDPLAALADPALAELPVTWFPQYQSIWSITGADRMVVRTMDGGCLLTDFHGVPVTGERYDNISGEAADDGAVLATKDGHTGILFPDGTFTIPEGCDSVVMRSKDGEFMQVSLNGVERVIRRDGALVALLDSPGATYGSAVAFHGNYVLLYGWDSRFWAYWYGVVDGDGNDVIPMGTYREIWLGKSGLIVYDGTGCGLVDWDGTVLIPITEAVQPGEDRASFSYIPTEESLYAAAGLPWTEETGGLRPYSTEDTPYGYRDETGVLVVPQVFDWAGEFSHGYSVVSYGGYYGLLKDPRNADKVSSWARTEVDEARALGLITARADGYYTYDITRLQFAELAVNLVEKATGKAAAPAEVGRFTDTDDETARKAAALGVVTGTGDGSTFAPGELITREQIATMLYRAVAVIYQERDGLGFTPVPTDLSAFTDGGQVADWAAQAVSQCAAWGVLEGGSGGAVLPQENTTVEQAILLILRTYRMV